MTLTPRDPVGPPSTEGGSKGRCATLGGKSNEQGSNEQEGVEVCGHGQVKNLGCDSLWRRVGGSSALSSLLRGTRGRSGLRRYIPLTLPTHLRVW